LDRFVDAIDRDAVISHDLALPGLLYDLFKENVRLRKMANKYQLRVLLIHRGKSLFHDPEAVLPKEEVIFAGAEYPFAWTQQEQKSEQRSSLFGNLFGWKSWTEKLGLRTEIIIFTTEYRNGINSFQFYFYSEQRKEQNNFLLRTENSRKEFFIVIIFFIENENREIMFMTDNQETFIVENR